MKSVLISIAALIISLISLLISFYRAGIDRRIQLDQARSQATIKLTTWCVDILPLIEEMRKMQFNNKEKSITKLLELATAIVCVRDRLQHLQFNKWIPASLFAVEIHKLKNDVEEIEPLFKCMLRAYKDNNINCVVEYAEGIIGKVAGKGNNCLYCENMSSCKVQNGSNR